MKKLSFEVREECRADVFFSEQTGLTRSAVKKLAEEGKITTDGKQLKAGQNLRSGMQAVIEIPDPVPICAVPEDIPIEIVYEDDDIAVVNKPQGMTVHAGAGNTAGTLVNALLFRLKSLSGINGKLRPGIVHRIDKDTSGLLVVAKNDAAHLSLSAQIENKSCKRTYLALLEGIVKNDRGTVTTYIGRDPKDRIKMAVVEPAKGKLAVTDYEVLKRYEKGFTLCRFDLHTGRTHQIRVHARHLGYPVVGDPVYGIKKQKFNLNGQLLHAWRLQLTHPRTGEVMSFEAPLPEYFQAVLNKLG